MTTKKRNRSRPVSFFGGLPHLAILINEYGIDTEWFFSHRLPQNSRILFLAGATRGNFCAERTLTYNPKGLILVVSSGPIADHSRATAKYDSSLTLNPITRALSTFITDTWRSCTERCIGIAEKEADEEGEKVKGSTPPSQSVFVSIILRLATVYRILMKHP